MLSASIGSGRGPGATLSSGASIAASAPSRSAVTLGPELAQQRGQRGQQRVERQRARSSGPHAAISTVSPAAARRSAQARSSVVFPMPASPSTTTTSTEPPRARAATASR